MDLTEAPPALDAVEQVWPALPDLIGSGWGRFQAALYARVSALDDAVLTLATAGQDLDSERAALRAKDAAEAELLELFDPYPDADALFTKAYHEALLAGWKRGHSAPPAGSDRYHGFFAVPVFYATDRRQNGPPEWYAGERAASEELSYGTVTVSVPLKRKLGTVPAPRWWHKGLSPHAFNPQLWSEIMRVKPIAAGPEFATAAGAVLTAGDAAAGAVPPRPGAASACDVLLLIHGYNVGFCAAARRAAQLGYDLDFTGAIVLYSWPSRDRFQGYAADRENAEWSTEHFVRFVQTVLPGIGARQVHVLAHSMGNRILVDALHQLRAGADPLGHVVFAAPDFDARTFWQRANAFAGKAASYTLYASATDRALGAAAVWAGGARIGKFVGGADAGSVVEVVETSQLPRQDVLGHSGFAADRTMLSDIKDIILHGRPADQRSALQPESDPEGRRYWAFPA